MLHLNREQYPLLFNAETFRKKVEKVIVIKENQAIKLCLIPVWRHFVLLAFTFQFSAEFEVS